MTYAFTQDVPIDVSTYRRIIDGLGPTPPEGLIVHLAIERQEGGLRYLDVWESEEHWERFAAERLHPVVHPVLMELIGAQPPEPPRTPLSAVDVWQGQTGHRPLAAATSGAGV
ncbi:MAG: hypothetical protein ABI352_09685 [Candidatus Dormibacter sp.]